MSLMTLDELAQRGLFLVPNWSSHFAIVRRGTTPAMALSTEFFDRSTGQWKPECDRVYQYHGLHDAIAGATNIARAGRFSVRCTVCGADCVVHLEAVRTGEQP